jgi:peptidyl-prolyl cis-trans isomerase C
MSNPLMREAVVNGEVIPVAAIAAEAQNHPAPAGKPGQAYRAAARALAVRALLLQEARVMGLSPEPQELAPGKRETDEEALVRAVIAARIEPEPVSVEACRAVYDAHPERFRSPRLYEAAHMLFPAAEGDLPGRAAAHDAAAQTLADLARDPRAFDRLARDRSACPSREAGGRLGQLAEGDTVPEFEAVLNRLAEGAIAPEPVRTRFGFHVIRLDARAESAPLPFAAVRASIAERLEKAAWARAAQALVAALAARATLDGVDFDAAA